MKDIVQSTIHLPSELLLEIFLKITERDNLSHSRLETACRCSQVCRLWRTFLLSSAHIWGRLMELDSLRNATDEWMELLLSGVGNSLLWITGRISYLTWPFFVKLLEEKWENVQIVEVWGSPRMPFDHIHLEGTEEFFGKPAPNLESFNLRLSDQWPITQTFTLFNDFAPHLREIDAPFFPNVSQSFMWARNLHRISFHAQYTSSGLLRVLKWMPQLRCLRIWRAQSWLLAGANQDINDVVPIRLPRLQSLQIFNCTQSDVLPFLELIEPSPTCSIMIHTTCSPSVNSLGSYASFLDIPPRFYRALLPWIQAYMKGRSPRSISITADDPNLNFRMFDHPAPRVSQLSKLEEEECLDIKLYLDSYCRSAIVELAMADIFSSVEQLSLLVANYNAWAPLYNKFSSVTELTLDAYNIDLTPLHIDNRERNKSLLFPQLRSLRVTLGVVLAGCLLALESNIMPRILDFMENRAGVGLPLSCLHVFVDDSNPDPQTALSDNDKERLANLQGLTTFNISSSSSFLPAQQIVDDHLVQFPNSRYRPSQSSSNPSSFSF